MWDIMSLKCTNWRVKCNLCASSAVLALERRFACAQLRPKLALVSTHERLHKKPPSK